jgi:hypothetical protein
MSSESSPHPTPPSHERSRIIELTSDAWKCPEQSRAECVAIRACEAYVESGIPVGANGAIAVRLDNIKNRFHCLVRANSYLVRLRVVEGRVVTIKSIKIANLP